MDALRRVQRALVPGGALVDLHPTCLNAHAECGGVELGAFDETEALEDVRATDAGLFTVVHEGLFALELERTFEWVEAFDTARELFETAATWAGFRIPPELGRAIRAASHPYEVHQDLVLRRLRALEALNRSPG